MATKPIKLLKAKPRSAPSHNADLPALIEKVQAEKEIPFQVRLGETLATRVKVYSATSGETHKTIVSEALAEYLQRRSA